MGRYLHTRSVLHALARRVYVEVGADPVDVRVALTLPYAIARGVICWGAP
jgi:hypothetical protein